MKKNWLKALSGSLCFLLTSSIAFGQDDFEDDLFSLSPAELANIPVTIATGTARAVYRSAAVTSVITAEKITEMGATELHEVLDTIPGLHVSIQPVTNDYTYSMRGIANNTNNQVLVLMNGNRYSTPYKGSHMSGMEIPLEAVQRIEVIRGPGSALYGADAFAGVINIITKKADDIDGTVVGARGGSWDTQSFWAQHGNHWLGWDIAASLQYSHNNADDDRIIGADAQSGLDRVFGTGASLTPGAMQTASERYNAQLNLQRKFVDINFWAFSEVDQGLRAGAAGALDNKGRLNGENYLAAAKFSTEDSIDDWELQLNLSYLTTEIDAQIYNFPAGTLLPLAADGNPTQDLSAVVGLMLFPEGLRTNLGIQTKVPSLQFSSTYKGFEDHLIRFSAGYRYEELNTRESRNFGAGVIDTATLLVPPNINVAGSLVDVTGSASSSLNDRHRDIWSLALQDEWKIFDSLQLIAGVRYDEYSDFGSTFNPRAALVWEVNSRLTTKLLYGQAYRAPSFLEQYQQHSQIFIGNPNLKPEEIETYEWAFDYRPVKDLRTALNIYYYKIDNLIGSELVSTSSSSLMVSNNEGLEGYGTEIEWDWQFHENWSWRGNYAWQYARNQAFKRRSSGVPEHQIYSALAWKFLPQWQLQTQLNWVGHRISPVNDARDLEDYETIDITLNGKKLFGYVDVTASVRNLFDSNGKEPAISAYPDSLPIPGQSFYFEANMHF